MTCCSMEPSRATGSSPTSPDKQNSAQIGENLAAKIVADSDGKAEHALRQHLGLPDPAGARQTSSRARTSSSAPTASTTSLDIPLTSLGKDAPDRIVSYLRSHPQVNYVVLSVSNALGAGLPAALRAAGLADKVKIVGQSGDTQTFQDLQAEQHQVRRPVRLLRASTT